MVPFRDELSCHLDIGRSCRTGFIVAEIDSAGDVFKRGMFGGEFLEKAFKMDRSLERGLAVGDRFDFKGSGAVKAFFFQIWQGIGKERTNPSCQTGKKSSEEFLSIRVEAKDEGDEVGKVKEKSKCGPDEKKNSIE